MIKRYTYNTEIYANKNSKSFYLLGLIASDGVIDGYHIKIGLKDKSLLETLRDDLVPGKPLYINKRDDTWYLKISNKKIMEFVKNAGITKRKSLTLKIKQPIVKDKLFKHFIRGYFDGDGTVGITRNTNGKSKKNYYRCSVRICSGSKKILEQIQNYLSQEYGLNKNKIIEENNHTFFRIRYVGSQAKMFYNVIYEEDEISLNRKKIKYSNILSMDSNLLAEYYGQGTLVMLESILL